MGTHPEHPDQAPEVCKFCGEDIWFDEPSETYETSNPVILEAITCERNDEGHLPAV